MIGIDQEPNRATLDRLNGALGEGRYSIEYRETPNGVAIIVQTREVPARVWSSQVANGVPRASVDGVWDELASRITAESKKGQPTTTAAHARQQAAPIETIEIRSQVANPPVDAEPGNPGEYGTRDYERQADGTYERKDGDK